MATADTFFLPLWQTLTMCMASYIILVWAAFQTMRHRSQNDKDVSASSGVGASDGTIPAALRVWLYCILLLLALLTGTSIANLAIHAVSRDLGVRFVHVIHDSILILAWLTNLILFYKDVQWSCRSLPPSNSNSGTARDKITIWSLVFWCVMVVVLSFEAASMMLCRSSDCHATGINGAVALLVMSRENSSAFIGQGNIPKFVLVPFILTITQIILLVLVILFFWRLKKIESKMASYSYQPVATQDSDQEEERSILSGQSQVSQEKNGFWSQFRKLLPFLWPKGHLILQTMLIASIMCIALGRVVNLLVPLQYKQIIDELTSATSTKQAKGNVDGAWWPWQAILTYALLRFLQGGAGVVSALRSVLWIRIGQFTTREISVRIFEHLHQLSLQFHLNRKTGEVLRVMDRGTSSISGLLNAICFNIVPTLVDIFVAAMFFVFKFDGWIGMIVFFTMAYYMAVTVFITEWRTKFRDNLVTSQAVDALLNFETVKYYAAERFEVSRYRKAILSYQESDFESQFSLQVLNLSQNAIITIGLVLGACLCAYQVVFPREGAEQRTVGDFVMFMTYLTQLYAPLNFFGTYYRMIQQNFIDMEKMMELFDQHVEIEDAPNAQPLDITGGRVVFDNVSFSYDGQKPALTNISFTVEPGQTVAFVGPSGGGKSTLLRLLFRFYDPQQGRILIDGQEIRKIQMNSLRQAIGVVPQDTVLFNNTIAFNIGYGAAGQDEAVENDFNLNDQEGVVYAAKAAQIHDKIEKDFPEGYETKVGERGLRLSGGEKQRVAVARTILKATSALDTVTEANIQHSLNELSAHRTTLVIAHRLSTIRHADCIFVLKGGTIIEKGTHDELLRNPSGSYATLWGQQRDVQK